MTEIDWDKKISPEDPAHSGPVTDTHINALGDAIRYGFSIPYIRVETPDHSEFEYTYVTLKRKKNA